jgi:hypothetical protein
MNCKKCTSLFLALLLLVSNIGLAFTIHYCEGKIASIASVFNTEELCETQSQSTTSSCCTKAIQTNHKACCKDKVVHLDDNSDEVIVKTFSFQSAIPMVIPSWNSFVFKAIALRKDTSVYFYFCDANAPPLFKLYSQFIFYA